MHGPDFFESHGTCNDFRFLLGLAFLNRTEIISVLNGFNPWWRARPYVVPPFRRLAFEVKYRENPQLDKKSGLGTYCMSENPRQAYLVTKRDVDFAVTQLKGIDTKFLKIPAARHGSHYGVKRVRSVSPAPRLWMERLSAWL
jgi:hypothetical protein